MKERCVRDDNNRTMNVRIILTAVVISVIKIDSDISAKIKTSSKQSRPTMEEEMKGKMLIMIIDHKIIAVIQGFMPQIENGIDRFGL